MTFLIESKFIFLEGGGVGVWLVDAGGGAGWG